MQHDESPVDDQAAGSVTIEIALVVDDELVVAFEQLIPQLSSSSPPPTREALCDLVDGADTTLFLARVDGVIVGSLTLAFYRIPTGMKAWIEDVVVDDATHESLVAAAAKLEGGIEVARHEGLISRIHTELVHRGPKLDRAPPSAGGCCRSSRLSSDARWIPSRWPTLLCCGTGCSHRA